MIQKGILKISTGTKEKKKAHRHRKNCSSLVLTFERVVVFGLLRVIIEALTTG